MRQIAAWVRWGVETRRWTGETPELYRRRAVAAHGWMRGEGWHGLSRGRSEHYYAWWQSLPETAASRNLGRKVLVAYGAWLVESGQRTSSPATGIPSWRLPRSVPKALSALEARRVASLVQPMTTRTATAVALMLHCGLRISETANLQWRDVEDHWLTIVGKGGVERRVPVSPDLRVLLLRWRLACEPSQWVLPGPSGQISTNTLRQHVVDLTGHRPHSMRHTAATELLGATGDLRMVQEYLGHASAQTTAIYAHVRPERMAEAVARMYGA